MWTISNKQEVGGNTIPPLPFAYCEALDFFMADCIDLTVPKPKKTQIQGTKWTITWNSDRPIDEITKLLTDFPKTKGFTWQEEKVNL